MRPNWRSEWPHWVVLAALFGAAVGARLVGADQGGNPVRGLLLPALAFGLYLLMLLWPRLDPYRANYARFAGAYRLIRLAVLLAAAGVYADLHPAALAGGLLIVVGGVLGKLRPNWFVGIRTPWTLTSRLAWTKTHRLAGWLLIAEGLTLLAAGLAGQQPAATLAALPLLLAGSAIGLAVYSYLVWRHDPDRDRR